MLEIKLGIELASLRLPFKKALLTARELGAVAVEIDARGELRPQDLSHTGVRQVRKMLDDLNLRVSCLSFRKRQVRAYFGVLAFHSHPVITRSFPLAFSNAEEPEHRLSVFERSSEHATLLLRR